MIEKENGRAVHPEVSVIMPAYNAEKYIAEAISSVVGQTFQNWELLVLDDCSQDRTCAIVEQFAADDRRIRLVRNAVNQGGTTDKAYSSLTEENFLLRTFSFEMITRRKEQ